MSMTVEGTVQRATVGLGGWTLVTADGDTYEIYQDSAPADLLQEGLKVKVKGSVREDVMTMNMVGPVLAVESFNPA
ncbi:MAG: hypothetical protein HC886_13375 [Leptolyngbyaceae cyanobacterium SM1_1_3]|nr:hypothetical protein [Leptolyngbyaceae cyanobacterium SM1_1_3]NJN01639.1 hypothetical protein [Leptolyngbyaceae cyanobacterium RM1_1_2]NJO10580.1 hypothetical protein [Leptolyngbyaceae cyanobacterium SL_1_1]